MLSPKKIQIMFQLLQIIIYFTLQVVHKVSANNELSAFF